MSISCTCDSDGGYDWYYIADLTDFKPLNTKRGRKCCACKKPIKIGDDCVSLSRYRSPNSDIEDRIYGDEVPMPTWYLCEECGGLAMALSDVDLCYSVEEPLKRQIQEWREMQNYYQSKTRRAA